MKIRWRLVSVGLVALSLIGVMTTYGWSGFRHGGHKFGHGGAGFPFRVLRALDLTAEQQTQIQTIKEAHRNTLEPLHTEMRSTRNEMINKFLTPGNLTTEELTSQAERMSTLTARLLKEQLAMGVEMRNVLTPDQLAKAAEIIAKKQAFHSEMERPAEKE